MSQRNPQKQLQDAMIVETLLAHFDFYKVHQVMHILDWAWGNAHENQSPTLTQLQDEARRLLESVIASPRLYSKSCGGFCVARGGDGHITLSFVLEECSTSDFVD